MNEYARKYNILKEADKKLSGEDVREGLTCVISVKVKEAQFEGQTKGKLGNTEIGGLVSSMVADKLTTFLEENPAVARAIFDKAMAASAPEAARRPATSCGASRRSKVPRCPASCGLPVQKSGGNRDPISSGDSAGGSAKRRPRPEISGDSPALGQDAECRKARLDRVCTATIS